MPEYANNGVMDWGDTIEKDGQEFVLLPEGDYTFTVSSFERGTFPGSEKLPACNKAVLKLSVETEQGTANIQTDLILHRSLEWKLASFFRSIGQKQHGEKLVMNWDRVTGAQGRAHFKPRSYTKNGQERQANNVDKFLDYEPDKMKKQEFKPVTASADDLPF